VDWAQGRLNVRSPKTEHHAGHDRRVVPITPKLMKLLQDAFDAALEGQQRIVTTLGHGNVHKTIHAAIKRAGVEAWGRLWQTCRSSCEKEWAMRFPQYAVSKWIGHSITVSGKHYANHVIDELMCSAAGMERDDDRPEQAAQKAAQQVAEAGCMERQAGGAGNEKRPEFPGVSEPCGTVQVAGGGFEPPTSGL
jgi:hypothetical protein